ncbi:hypothetical protein [Glycomyces arizonensis]|uniref:hypothetical protein n=1 Tax=Glycomyces arizonensis TaxID=256035 RepID=UPI0004215817|nr:hypothetical protein [Glycomyces arizonensis]
MKVLFVMPFAKKYRTMRTEPRLAADDGHEVHLIAEFRPHWEHHSIDPRVNVHWLRTHKLFASSSTLVTWTLCRLPRGVLRRLRRGPLARPAAKALRAWNRKVVKRIERRRKRREGELRQRHRVAVLRSLMAAHDFDWLVLPEPSAIDLLADDLPGLLERRPDLRTTYAYEDFLAETRA